MKIGISCLTADNNLLKSCHNLCSGKGRFASEKQKKFFLNKKAKDEIWGVFQEEDANVFEPGDKLFVQGEWERGGVKYYYGFVFNERGVRVRLARKHWFKDLSSHPIPYDSKKYHRGNFYRREINAGVRGGDLEPVWSEIEIKIFV